MPVKKFLHQKKNIFCFQKYGKSAHAEHRTKSCVLTKVIYTILEID